MGGEAVYYLNELNKCELIEALYNIQNIDIRQRLIKAGSAQAKHFLYPNMADTVVDVCIKTHEKIKIGEIRTISPIWNTLRKQQSFDKDEARVQF